MNDTNGPETLLKWLEAAASGSVKLNQTDISERTVGSFESARWEVAYEYSSSNLGIAFVVKVQPRLAADIDAILRREAFPSNQFIGLVWENECWTQIKTNNSSTSMTDQETFSSRELAEFIVKRFS